jgi:hypothetical protein
LQEKATLACDTAAADALNAPPSTEVIIVTKLAILSV